MALAWAWAGLVIERDHLDRWWLGVVLLLGATVASSWLSVRTSRGVTAIAWFEVGAGVLLLIGDALVYEVGRSQSLPWAWPAAGIIAVAIAGGIRPALAAATVVSVASFAGESLLRDELQLVSATASKSALMFLAALSAAQVAAILRRAEAEISTARAREEMGRVLHDGVLQTLAVVQRRSDDDDLVALATEQERDLRSYLFGEERMPDSLAVALRAVADDESRRHRIEVQTVIADDLPELEAPKVLALAGAVREAVTNAAKHAEVTSVSLYAEPADDGGAYCSVMDRGVGFDAESTSAGRGIRHSIDARLSELGGRYRIASAPGRGTEVEMWLS